MSGLATWQMLKDLHGLLAIDLTRRLKGKPTADDLACTRAFLRDQRALGDVLDEKDRRRMERMYGLYVRKLEAALDVERPSAAIFQEVRIFLQAQRVGKDLGAAIDHSKALQVLALTSLPFTKTPH